MIRQALTATRGSKTVRLRLTFNDLSQDEFIRMLKSCKNRKNLLELKCFAQFNSTGRPVTQAVMEYIFKEASKIISTGNLSTIDFETLISNRMAVTFIPPPSEVNPSPEIHTTPTGTYTKVKRFW